MDGFVELEDVKKIYQMGEVEIMAAAGIDFQVQKGEFAVVVGPSGNDSPQYPWWNGHGYVRPCDGGWTGYCQIFPAAADRLPKG